MSVRSKILTALFFFTTSFAFAQDSWVAGFNQAWIGGAYGHQWTDSWNEAESERMIRSTRELGATILRMWIFEGVTADGVFWDGSDNDHAGTAQRSRPTGIDPRVIAHLRRFMELAARHQVKIYWTLFDGNFYSFLNGPGAPARRNEWWNLLNDDHGTGAAFRQHALTPVIDTLKPFRQHLFAIDLVNEINPGVRENWYRDGWEGCRKFARTWRAHIKERIDVPVTASFGHHDAVSAMLGRGLTPDVVDFYDFHLYNDQGEIPSSQAITRFMRQTGRPVYLGEFGQSSKAFDDALQSRVTERFMRATADAGLSGCLAWRLSDVRPGHNPEARHSYEAFGKWRPAAATFRRIAGELARSFSP